MATTEHQDTVPGSTRERPRTSDIKQLFERYRRASRRLDDAERSSATWVTPPAKRKRAPVETPTKS